jgi:voltage-gated potassium channel
MINQIQSKQRVIIYGFLAIASEIANILRNKKYDILIIDTNEKVLQRAQKDGFDTQKIDSLEDKEFLDIGMDQDNLKAFFCMGEDKNENLLVVLSVRNLNKNLKIIALSDVQKAEQTLMLAGANKVINPYEIGALRISRLLHKPAVLDVLDNILFSDSDIVIEEIFIEKNSILDGVYLKDVTIPYQEDLIILGIQDKELGDKFIFFGAGINHKIDYGDTLVVLGRLCDLQKFRREISS